MTARFPNALLRGNCARQDLRARPRWSAPDTMQRKNAASPAIIPAARWLPESNAATAEMTVIPHSAKANRGRNFGFSTD